jgi:hypothetical protein
LKFSEAMGARTSCCIADFADAQAPIAKTENEAKVVEALADQAEASTDSDPEPSVDSEPAVEEKKVGGCFLVYSSEENQGTLRNFWSETEVEGALAVLRPRKAVPRHKYTTNWGKSDILKQANLGVHKQRHCEGFGQFLKSGRAWNADFVVYSDAVRVVLALKDEGVLEVSAGTVPVDASDAVAICVAPRDVTIFNGVKKMNLQQFAFKAQHCGGGFFKF